MGEGHEIAPTPEQLRRINLLTLSGRLMPAGVHDAKNLVALVAGNLDYLERQLALTEPQAEALGDASEGARRLLSLLKTLGGMAAPGVEKRESFEVGRVVAAAEGYLPLAFGKSVLFSKEVMSCPPLHGVPHQIAQVLVNLLFNARNAVMGCEQPTVRLEVSSGRSGVRFSVIDNGVGVSGDVERLFAPFRSEWSEGVGDRSGLGLTVARTIARAHGGRLIGVAMPGGGSRFTLSMPVVQSSASRGRVMLVDDDVRVLGALRRLLSRKYDVVTFSSGNQAMVALAEDSDYHIVISDLMMADGNGRDLHAWIARNKPTLLDRLVFITGATYGLELTGFHENVALPVLEKPIEPEDLRKVVAEYVARFGAE